MSGVLSIFLCVASKSKNESVYFPARKCAKSRKYGGEQYGDVEKKPLKRKNFMIAWRSTGATIIPVRYLEIRVTMIAILEDALEKHASFTCLKS